VDLGVLVSAGVGQDGEAVVEVGGLAEGGEDDATGGDAGQDEAVGVGAAQQDVEVAAAERADPALDDDRLVRAGFFAEKSTALGTGGSITGISSVVPTPL
jgi:hypothetical protein